MIMKMKNLNFVLKTRNFQSFSKPSYPFQSFSSSSINVLTQQEINKINLLIPRLCLTNNVKTAVHLTVTALVAMAASNPQPPPKSLSLSILVHSLTSQPDLALPMSILTKLKHTPQALAHPSVTLTPLCTLLVCSYLKKGRPKDALKVYGWMLRPGSPCGGVENLRVVLAVLVGGLCREGMIFEALRVLRDMVAAGLVVSGGLRERVFRSLLREARVREARKLDAALEFIGSGGDGGLNKVLDLLDQMIASWTD